MLGIAENHGGFVHLETKLGAGTTFYVYIPAAPGDAGGENQPARAANPPRARAN